MPPQPHPESVEYQLAKELNRQREIRAREVAAHQGPPPGHRRLTEAEELRLWNQRDGRVDINALKAGQPLDPDIVMKHPSSQRVMELIQAGALPEAASLLAFPFRYRLMVAGRPSIKEQTEYAERMDAKSQQLRQELASIMPRTAVAATAHVAAPAPAPPTPMPAPAPPVPAAGPPPNGAVAPGPEGAMQPPTPQAPVAAGTPTGPADAQTRMGLSELANPGRTPGVPGQHELTRIGELAKRITSGEEPVQ